MAPIRVEKRTHTGALAFAYEGDVIERSSTHVCLVATFRRNDVDAGYIIFRKGDTMTEWFFTDRWFNIFHLQDVISGKLKGWYCNITRPALIDDALVAADDLALDVFVSPQGDIQLLDEDEFAALDIDAGTRAAALAAVDALTALVNGRVGTFAEISD
jgi:uncharacterized protein